MDYKYNDDFQCISATDAAEQKNIRIQPANVDDVSAGIGNSGDTGNIIKVIGVGGGGSNAVNQLAKSHIVGVDLIVCNTDRQALNDSLASIKIQLGKKLTAGLGAGNDPKVGEDAAKENLTEVTDLFNDNTKMVFVTAGMGGGTGTGAAPVIAKAAKEKGMLTIGVVTVPFTAEGTQRINQANEGVMRMRDAVDALLVINDDKLIKFKDCTFSTAFQKADEVVVTATKGIAEIITRHGHVNVDFRDVNSVMKDSGVALLGSAEASGEGRDLKAISEALDSPLLHDNDIKGAKNILLNITTPRGEHELTMPEFENITNHLTKVAGQGTNVIWGTCFDDSLGENIRTTVIATGFPYEAKPMETPPEVSTIEFGQPLPMNDVVLNPAEMRSPSDFKHMSDLDKLNDDAYLASLENETALDRKNKNN
ncbi:MAG: cell division protein FtsZ [Bacteroidales bacterium]|nr:cell division protein FtsZ [Bacteroidales bacterium]